MLKKIFTYFLCMSVCACATKVSPALPEKPQLNISNPSGLKMEPVQFVIIHKDNADSAFEKLESQGSEPIVFGLTGKDYKNLSINMEKLKSYIILQRTIIKKYKEYYEGAK